MAPTTLYPTHDDHATHQQDLDHEVDALAADLADETDPTRRAELVELIVLQMLPLGGRPRDAVHAAAASRPTTCSRWPARPWSRRSTATAPAPAPASPPSRTRRSPASSSAGSATTAGRCARPAASRSCGPAWSVEEERLRHVLSRNPERRRARPRPRRLRR